MTCESETVFPSSPLRAIVNFTARGRQKLSAAVLSIHTPSSEFQTVVQFSLNLASCKSSLTFKVNPAQTLLPLPTKHKLFSSLSEIVVKIKIFTADKLPNFCIGVFLQRNSRLHAVQGHDLSHQGRNVT